MFAEEVVNTCVYFLQLGAKKGLGGQKVKANFNEIENEALQKDKEKAQLAENIALQEAKTKEEQEKKM